jgi:hypothetical protein
MIKREEALVKDSKSFDMMPFEWPNNGMSGTFTYPTLLSRLHKIRSVLDAETTSWLTQGPLSFSNHERTAQNLEVQFAQCKEYYAKSPAGVNLTLDHPPGNPFYWAMVRPPPAF